LHKADWLAIELISGFPAGRGLIALSERGATLELRLPANHYRDVLSLAGKRLDIGGHQIRLGLPVARPLEPAPSLYARVVTIKKFTEPEPFLEAVKRKLDSFGVKGRVELPRDVTQTVSLRSDNDSKLETENSKLNPRYRRRIVTIHGKSVVGFSIAVHELNDGDSLLLQAGAVKVVSPDDGATQWQNIFSRRAMGCGFFNPISEMER
jgi:CRISPR-associated protein Cas6